MKFQKIKFQKKIPKNEIKEKEIIKNEIIPSIPRPNEKIIDFFRLERSFDLDPEGIEYFNYILVSLFPDNLDLNRFVSNNYEQIGYIAKTFNSQFIVGLVSSFLHSQIEGKIISFQEFSSRLNQNSEFGMLAAKLTELKNPEEANLFKSFLEIILYWEFKKALVDTLFNEEVNRILKDFRLFLKNYFDSINRLHFSPDKDNNSQQEHYDSSLDPQLEILHKQEFLKAVEFNYGLEGSNSFLGQIKEYASRVAEVTGLPLPETTKILYNEYLFYHPHNINNYLIPLIRNLKL